LVYGADHWLFSELSLGAFGSRQGPVSATVSGTGESEYALHVRTPAYAVDQVGPRPLSFTLFIGILGEGLSERCGVEASLRVVDG
jgi:hypothetical protein